MRYGALVQGRHPVAQPGQTLRLASSPSPEDARGDRTSSRVCWIGLPFSSPVVRPASSGFARSHRRCETGSQHARAQQAAITRLPPGQRLLLFEHLRGLHEEQNQESHRLQDCARQCTVVRGFYPLAINQHSHRPNSNLLANSARHIAARTYQEHCVFNI